MKKWLILLCMISAFVGCGNDENEIKQNFQENEAKESQNQSKETFINEERSLRSQSPQKWLEKYDVNAKDSNGETLLMFFAAYGSDDEVKYLLAQGADVNATDKQGQSALLLAAKFGYDELVAALLELGANPNMVGYYTTPLLEAATNNYYHISKLLLEHGADVNLRAQDNGTTPIIALVEGESKGFLSFKDRKERTKEEDKAHIPLLELFIKSGGDVNAQDFMREGYNINALSSALELERENLAVLLIKSGVNVKDESYPPLNDAVQYGLVNAVEALLKVGANPMQKGYSQTSALDIIGENKLERINGEYARTLFHSLEPEKQSRIKELMNQAIETINP